jgi:hypothetical protein
MPEIKWNLLKSERLKTVRGVSFEEILQAKLIAIKKHHGREHQNVMLFEHQGYIWVVPYVMAGEDIFLKTLYPSRRYTKLYKKGEIQ